ncbi:hypothetical protein AQPE_1681 [Aquipluma nitroreducens]|uniref:Uncharacterized protein n=1 Tax=Aquipluma nitroreducens TaxID=2010828 RepID=A0A5K7S7N0_9BACT|nr:hypothetical protein [Aquipluma nitroreducens]BBE17530.1 hypothetical protein AQPE_1681 [Aquipluma nitroreducens]
MQKNILVICLIIFLIGKGYGQTISTDSLRADFDKLYGLDVLLNNGKKYFPDKNPIIGHAFWKSKDPFWADVTISGRTFKNQKIKYNLDKQEFLLIYTNFNGQQGQIILNASVIDSVNGRSFSFVPNRYSEIKQQFVQLIYQGRLSCYIGWYKELKISSINGVKSGYEFSDDFHKNYLVYKGAVYRFSSKSSFLRIFNQTERVSIRKYFSVNRFTFKSLDDIKLKKLIVYCDEILI